MKGRKPKSVERAHWRPDAPTKAAATLKPPQALGSNAAAVWKHTVQRLAQLGRLEQTDPHLLYCFSEQVGLFLGAQKQIHESGATYKTATGFRREVPEVAIARKACSEARLLAVVLGLGVGKALDAWDEADPLFNLDN